MSDFETEVKKKLEEQIRAMELSGVGRARAAYSLYVAKLRELNEVTKEQYKKDSFGLNKALNPEQLAMFKQLYAECGKYGQALLTELAPFKEEPGCQVIRSIQDLLIQDFNVINKVQEADLKDGTLSLQKIVDESRVLTVDISGRNLGTVGANMSSRIPFNYVAPDGKELPGVFTPKNNFNIEGDFDKIISETEMFSPQCAAAFRAFKTGTISYYNKKLEAKHIDINTYTNGQKLLEGLVSCLLREPEGDPNRFINAMNKLDPAAAGEFLNYLKTRGGMGAYKRVAAKLVKFCNSANVNLSGARISDGSRIDSRNSAMSSVADLLGVPDLICRAMPMKIVQNGEEVEGTFMTMAKGEDIKSPNPACFGEAYESDGPVFSKANGLKSVADLQILDFICGNVDRHAGNMFYQFDTTGIPGKHKFLGVQGIDNDASFGTFVPSNSKESSLMRLCSLEKMMVISQSMATRVMSLTPEMLAFTLRDKGLTDKQVDAAGKRLVMLKDFIAASMERYRHPSNEERSWLKESYSNVLRGTVRIIDDNDFAKLKLDNLAYCGPRGNESNIFYMVQGFRECCLDELRENPAAQRLVPDKIEEKQLYTLPESESKWAADIVKKLSDSTSMNRTSEYYTAVEAAANRYKGFCESNKGSVLSEDLYALKAKYLKDIHEKAQAYCDYKRSVKKPSKYTQRRIDTVTDILNQSSEKVEERYYEKMMDELRPDARKRYADGLHKYADKSLDDFNARMRKMAEEIARKNGVKIPSENRAEKAAEKAKENIIGM